MEGQKIMMALFGNEYMEKLKTDGEIIFESKVMEERLKSYLNKMADSEYKDVIKAFDMVRSYDVAACPQAGALRPAQKETLESGKKLYEFLKQLMKVGFDIRVDTESRGTRNKDSYNYNNIERIIDIKKYKELVEKYQPAYFVEETTMSTYNIIDTDSDEDFDDELS